MARSSILSKIVQLSDVRMQQGMRNRSVVDAMGTQNIERRIKERFHSDESLFVQIVASENAELVGTTVSCTALDVSVDGMRIESKADIPEGCKLDIWVDVMDKPGKFFLTSDVRWSKPVNNGHCEIGIELGEGTATDISAWRELHTV